MNRIEIIDECMSLLRDIWLKNPELRFNQLIFNLQNEYIESTGETGWYVNRKIVQFYGEDHYIEDDRYIDMFHLLDNNFIDFLRDYLKNT